MSPANVLFVFRRIILRIENQHIHVAQEFDHLPVFAVLSGFGVGEKRHQPFGRKQPVADAKPGMVRTLRPHADRADVEIEILEFLNFDVAGQSGKRHGEIRAFHLAGQRVDQAFARAFAAQNPQLAVRIVNRRKKRQPLNVVPVRVRQQQRQAQRLILEFRQQRAAQRAQPRTRIKDDDVVARTHFDAGRVAAVAHRGRSRRGDRAAHAPKFYAGGGFDGTI